MTNISNFDDYESISNDHGRKGRFEYAKVLHKDKTYFMKVALNTDGVVNLRRELIWADFMQLVIEKYSTLNIRAPKDYVLKDERHLLMEYLHSSVLATPDNVEAWQQHIDRYTDVLVGLDIAAQAYTVPIELRVAPPRRYEDALESWLEGMEKSSLVSRALTYISDHRDDLVYCMQHGDFTPWQIFTHRTEWVIFDGERSGDDLPRFNDLAYSYGRLAIRCGQPQIAEYMLNQFVARHDLDQKHFYKMFTPVCLIRLLGMLGDAHRDGSTDEISATEKLLAHSLDRSQLA